MTPKSLFTVILKILGILYIKDFLQAVVEILQMVVQYGELWDDLFVPVFICFRLLVYAGLVYYLVFRTEYVIKKCRLDEGFTQDVFSFSIHRSTVLSLATMITGALLIIHSVPFLLKSIFDYTQQKTLVAFEKPDPSYMIIYAAKIIIGLILAGNHKLIVNYIEMKRKGRKDPA